MQPLATSNVAFTATSKLNTFLANVVILQSPLLRCTVLRPEDVQLV